MRGHGLSHSTSGRSSSVGSTLSRRGSFGDLSTSTSQRKDFPASAEDYAVQDEIGSGATATVWKAKCIPLNETVAIKCLDLEKCNSSLDELRREAQFSCMVSHPNLVRSYCSFAKDEYLWVVMPFLEAGSCLHIMKSHFPRGLEEHVIATILRETLQGLEYLHRHGHIHRDVKAGNILLDSHGNVKVADFGVSAAMFDTGDRLHARKTFVGTPCWMAPEVLQQEGYDFKADIWSFGITALELAHGHAPFDKCPPMKVLMMTLQGPAPGLNEEGDKKFSRHFRDLVAACLVKDPSKRPSSTSLLKHPFFKQAKAPEYLVKHLLNSLPPLTERVKAINAKDAAMMAKKQTPQKLQEERSQSEYQRGVSGWNFDVADLKRQAALMDAQTDAPKGPPNASIPEEPSPEVDALAAKANGLGLSGRKAKSSPGPLEPQTPADQGRTEYVKGRFKVFTGVNQEPGEDSDDDF